MSVGKRAICIIMTFIIVTTSALIGLEAVMVNAQAASKDAINIVYKEDYEAQSVGSVNLNGYLGAFGANDWRIISAGGTQAWQMTCLGTNPMHLGKNIDTSVTENAILSLRVCLPDYGAVEKGIWAVGSGGSIELCHFYGDSLMMYDGTIVSGFMKDKFYDLQVVIDFETKTTDLYFNGKRRVNDFPMQLDTFSDITMIRIHLQRPKGQGSIITDDMYLYTGSTVYDSMTLQNMQSDVTSAIETAGDRNKVTMADVENVMGNALALYMNKPNARVKNINKYISENRNVTPIWQGENALVPVRFFVESLGGKVSFDSARSCVNIKYGEKNADMVAGENSMTIDGEKMALAVPLQIINGVSYAPVYELCDALELYLFLESDLLICSEENMNLSWEQNLALLRKIAESFIYDDVTGEQIVSMVKEKWPDNGHPRMIMTKERFAQMRAEYEKYISGQECDEIYSILFKNVTNHCESYMNIPLVSYTLDPTGTTLKTAHTVENRVLALALMYRASGDERYAKRCKQEVMSVCGFPDWAQNGQLTVGAVTHALALAYDWLYDYFDELDRQVIVKAIVEKGLKPAQNDFDGVTILSRDASNPLARARIYYNDPIDNFRFVFGASVGMGALAICDAIEGEELLWAQRTLEQSLVDMRPAISLFAPDGGYEEGPSYWEYSCRYYLHYLFSMQTALDTDFGYSDAPGLKQTNDYKVAINSPNSFLAYHDTLSGTSGFESSVLGWADIFKNSDAAQPRIDAIRNGAGDYYDLILYKPYLSQTSGENSELDKFLSGTGLWSARSGYGKDAVWVSHHADSTPSDGGHKHFDGGSFALSAMGEDFFIDLGKDEYSLLGYGKLTYRTRAEGHNTVLINPGKGQYGQYDMQFAAQSKIYKKESKPRGAYSLSDITDLYREDLEKGKRGVKLDNYRRTVTIQDELVMKEPSEFYWFAHTDAQITLSEDEKTAFITKNGKTLIAEITHGNGATFSVMDAKPLPTTPEVKGQNPNTGIRKLTIHMKNVKELDLMVVFNCYNDDFESLEYGKEFIPMDEWTLPEGPYDLEYVALKSITVNGEAIENFAPSTYNYSLKLDEEAPYPVIAATSDGDVRIGDPVENADGTFTIKIVALPIGNKQQKTYTLIFKRIGKVKLDGGVEVRPVIATASAEPSGEDYTAMHTIDNDLDTRWACDGVCWIKYDLGEVKELYAVALSFMDSKKRTAQFSIEISEDGMKYVKVFEGDTIPTDDYEFHMLNGKKARYVRVNCMGYNNNKNNWNSLMEFKAFVTEK